MESSIVKFFDGARVLVTGGTGFMGKVLLEKLLRTCLGIDRIYLIIRIKKGKNPAARLAELFADPLFSQLKSKVPDYANKVTCVPGDCSLQGLGMSDGDRALLTSTVTHIFHGAATVRFADPLRSAININVVAVREMMLFCRTCEKLKVVTHTSTAYAYVPEDVLEEKLYQAPMDGDSAIRLLDSLSNEKLETLTEAIISPWPNTYVFTKAIGEEVVRKYGQGLPICIFRPSIVCATAEEPIQGWTGNRNGPGGVFIGASTGIIRVICGGRYADADLVPVDKAVNALICASWQTARRHRSHPPDGTRDIPVYNYVAPKDNKITWKTFHEMGLKNCIPSNQCIWYYTLTLTKTWALYKILAFFFHIVPAILIDTALLLSGNKPRMMQVYKKVDRFAGAIFFCVTRHWTFASKNMSVVQHEMSSTDRKLFNFDISKLDWDEYVANMIKGNRQYLLKEDPSTIPNARRRHSLFKVAHRLFQAILYSSLAYLLYNVMSVCSGLGGTRLMS